MDRYMILCTGEQTKKALELGAPIKKTLPYANVNTKWAEGYIELSHGYVDQTNRTTFTLLKVPTAEQMIGFIESISEIQIVINKLTADSFRIWVSERCSPFSEIIHMYSYKSREEATLAAIDAALDYLSKK